MLFISHRTADKAAAEDLKKRALARGYSAEQLFLDSDPDAGIAAGDKWRHVIYNRLKQCQALIVVYSPRWKESIWCPAELGAAETLGKLVFPVVIEDCPIDAILSEHQSVFVFREGEAAFDRLWDSLERRGLGPHDYRPWPPDNGDPCPYPGLMAFSERFASVYYGREPETIAVLDELNKMRSQGEPRLLMIHGGSGSGKSSLMRAGVLPRLEHNPDWLVLPTLRYGSEDSTILERLAQELVVRFPKESTSKPDWEQLRTTLESNDMERATSELLTVVKRLTFDLNCRDATVLLPIDQFEELLAIPSPPSAERFLGFLKGLLARNNGRLLVIGTLRSDYLDAYERHPNALQPPYFHTYRLPPFPWERVTDVIVQPAARLGVTFTNELLERLKQDAPTGDALPLLAFTLEKLFRECASDNLIELHEYESLGGMTGAIEQAVRRIVSPELSREAEQALRLSFVRYLVQVNEKNEFVRLAARWTDLPSESHPLLEKFIGERLLQTSGEDKAKTIEVSHEAIFRCWDKLANWLNESARVLRWRRDVERDRKNASDAVVNQNASLWRRPIEFLGQLFTGRDQKNWSGLTRVQLAVSRRWPTEIPDELSVEEINWIEGGIRRERVFRSTVSTVILLILGLGTSAWYQRSNALSANQRSLKQLHTASMADHASARKAWQEHYDGEREGRWVGSVGQTSKWHEAVALWVRALELESTNTQASYWLYDVILRNGHVKANLPKHTLPHEGFVRSASFSPDGARVVTASDDYTARVWDVASGAQVGEPLRHEGPIRSASFSPDGARVVTASDDYTARVWDVGSGAQVGDPLRHEGPVNIASFSPDGARVVTANWDHAARVWDVASGKPVGEPLRHEGPINSASFSPDGLRVVTASWDHTARVWDTASGMPVGEPLRHVFIVYSGSFSPDGVLVVTASDDDTARVWEIASGKPLGKPLQHQGPVYSASFRPDGVQIVTASLDHTARVWDAATGAPVGEPLRHEGIVSSASFSPDGAQIVTASNDCTARVWDVASGAPVGEPLRHERTVRSASFSPDGARVVTASDDYSGRIWHLASGAPLVEPLRHEDTVNCASFSPDGARVVTASYDNTAQIWDAASGAPVFEPLRHLGTVSSASFSPDGRRVVTASEDKTARVWDAASGAPVVEPLRHLGTVSSASFSPDGRRVVTASEDKTARVWDVASGAPVGQPLQHIGTVSSASFSPDGRRVVTASEDKTARVWDVASGAPVGQPLRHEGPLRSASFSPDGVRVVTASDDKTVRVWDVASGAPLFEPLRHESPVMIAFFSLDGTRVLTASYDNTARVWDVASGTPVGELLRHEDTVNSASFSPDGAWVVTASDDNTARVWDVASGAPVGEPLRHEGFVRSASFSPDGAQIVTASFDCTARVWDVATAAEQKMSKEMFNWARAVAGLRFKDNADLEIVSNDDRRKVLYRPTLPPGPWEELAAWIETTGTNRTISPQSKLTLRQIAERERDFGVSPYYEESVGIGVTKAAKEKQSIGDRLALESALRFDQTVPLARMMLANILETEELAKKDEKPDKAVLARAAHWRRYDLDRLPDVPKLRARAAEILRQLPNAQVGVGPKPITAAEAANQLEQQK